MSARHPVDILTAAAGAALIAATVGAVASGLLFVGMAGPLALMVMVVAFLIGLPVALIHAILLGFPLYLAVEKLGGRLSRLGAAFAGLAVGGLPVAVLIGMSEAPYGRSIWDGSAVVFVLFALSGLAGGLFFRRRLGDEAAA
ncbi:MAG: hypothetical protein V4574_03835 [Pseudomonadota bacterium]